MATARSSNPSSQAQWYSAPIRISTTATVRTSPHFARLFLRAAQVDVELHCLRTRQCGAILESSLVGINARDNPYLRLERQPAQEQLFRWPGKGGVWLRAPVYGWTLEEQLLYLEHDPEERLEAHYRSAHEQLRGATDMESVCNILQDAGAQYYADAATILRCNDSFNRSTTLLRVTVYPVTTRAHHNMPFFHAKKASLTLWGKSYLATKT